MTPWRQLGLCLVFLVAMLCGAAVPQAQAGKLLQRWMEARIERNTIHKGSKMSSESNILMTGDTVLWNAPYGDHERQKLDVYMPPQAQSAPIVLMVHGGGWIMGDKAHETVVQNKGKHYLAKGYIFASTNYRLVPTTDPVGQVKDIAAAMKYVQQNASAWGGDPSRIILMGHSAGGHLVTLLASNPSSPVLGGVKPWRGTVSLDSAAMDVEALMAANPGGFYQQAFGSDRNFWLSVSPYHQLTARAKPMLLICSLSRGEDSCGPVEKFAQKAGKLGVAVTALPAALGHGDITINLGLESDYTNAVDAFITAVLK